ncbi:glycosyltransferase family 4 protein [Calidifontibacter indicus]|uniref:glycosyltransferase family 4 protein n=1 Tax=Calidifontibacter indicus TaxID=419650 RepID=UPI003D75669A
MSSPARESAVETDKPKRILLIAPACDGEDVGEAWLAFQWVSLLADRYDVTVISSYKKGHTPLSAQLPRVRVVEWPEPSGVHRLERLNSLMQPGYGRFYRRCRRWIKDHLATGECFDLAHQVVPVAMRYPSPASGLGIPLVLGPVGGSLNSPPAFVNEEGATPWWQRLRRLDAWRLRHDPLLRRTYEKSACVVGIAPYVRDILAPLNLTRLEFISDVAVHALPPTLDRTSVIQPGPTRVLFVGRVIRTKGVRDLIRAFGELKDLNIRLDILGDGNDRGACIDLVQTCGEEARITFHGRVPREQVDDFYRSADIFAFPSYREPGGSVVLEAMSYGLPVIVCGRGGPGTNVSGECAIRLDANSPEQLARDCAAAIRTLVQDSELRLKMGEAAREHVARHHLWSMRIESLTQIYRGVWR